MPAALEADLTPETRTVVLVEGVSDQLAVTALAARDRRDLSSEGVSVLSMHGATNITHFLRRYGPQGLDLGLAGLYDAAEMRFFQRGFELAGLGEVHSRRELEDRRFFVCDVDLEDELIRALGVAAVELVIAEQRELSAFRTLQQQPAQQGKTDHAMLRRFMGTRGGRKIQYAPLLVAALQPDRIPKPLARLMAAI